MGQVEHLVGIYFLIKYQLCVCKTQHFIWQSVRRYTSTNTFEHRRNTFHSDGNFPVRSHEKMNYSICCCSIRRAAKANKMTTYCSGRSVFTDSKMFQKCFKRTKLLKKKKKEQTKRVFSLKKQNNYIVSGFQKGTQEQHEDEIKPHFISRQTYRGSDNLMVRYRKDSQLYWDVAAESDVIKAGSVSDNQAGNRTLERATWMNTSDDLTRSLLSSVNHAD